MQCLVPLSDLKTLGDEFIHVLMIATLEENVYSSMSLKILDQLSKLFKSIIQNSLGSSLHIIIVSDENSKMHIRYWIIIFIQLSIPVAFRHLLDIYLFCRESIENVIGKYLSELLIMNYYREDYAFPKIKIEFASLKSLLDKNRDRVDTESEH